MSENFLRKKGIYASKTDFRSNPTLDEQLAIETCPGYNQALDKALRDFHELKKCRDCPLKVCIYPGIHTAVIIDKCPKT